MRVAHTHTDTDPSSSHALQECLDSLALEPHCFGSHDVGKRWLGRPEVQLFLGAVQRNEPVAPGAFKDAKPEGGLAWAHALTDPRLPLPRRGTEGTEGKRREARRKLGSGQ